MIIIPILVRIMNKKPTLNLEYMDFAARDRT